MTEGKGDYENTVDTPDLLDILTLFERNLLNDISTCFPGRIEEYDPVTQTADIQPLIQRPVISEDDRTKHKWETRPIIPRVKVIQPRTANAYIHLPVAVGDIVLVVCCEQDLGHWQAGDGALSHTLTAEESRFHSSNAVAIVGLYPDGRKLTAVTEANKDEIRVGFQGGATLRMKPGGDVIVETAGIVTLGGEAGAQFVARADRVDAAISELRTKFTTHVHAMAALGVPSPPLVAGSPPIFTAVPSASDQAKTK